MITKADIDGLIRAHDHYRLAIERVTGKPDPFGACFDTLGRFLEAATACNASIRPCIGMNGSFTFSYADRDFFYFAREKDEEEVG